MPTNDTQPCAGRTTRVSNRAHPICRGCARWQYGTPNGITPDFVDYGGTASCGDRVVHGPHTVGAATTTPQVGGVG